MNATPRPLARHPILTLAPRQLLASLVSFEALLVLYLFAGIYKEDPRFAWIPVDPTGLFFALSVVVGGFIILLSPIHKKGLPVVLAMVCLVTWLMFSLLWSPSRVYGPEKVFFLATLALWAVIAGALIIAPDPERTRRLFSLLLLFGLWMGVEVVWIYFEAGGQVTQIHIGEANYLMLGRLCGLGALVALAAWLYGRGGGAGWLCLALFVILGFVLAIGGGRGPLLATVLPLLIPVALGIRLTARKILYSRTQLSVLVLLLAMAGGFALYGELTGHRLATFERLERLAEGEFRRSEAVRGNLYAEASEVWSQAPLLGHGAGGWTVATGRPDRIHYPHNVVAELLVEGGMVALILFVVLVATALRGVSFERLRHDPQAVCAVMLFANGLLNAMLSADLPGNRAMFLTIGVLALLAVRPGIAPTPVAPPSEAVARSWSRRWRAPAGAAERIR
jgi:O-antigen ligase